MGKWEDVKGIIIFTIVLMTLLQQLTCSSEEKGSITQAIPVEVYKAKYKQIDMIERLTGEIRPFLEVSVYPKIPGYIIKDIFVDTGKYVKMGSVIAEMETDTVLAQLEEARAGLEQTITQRDIAEKDYNRLQKLYEQNAVPKQKLDHIESQYKLAKAQVKSIEAKIKQLEILHKNHKVYASIDGYVSMKYVDKGALSNPRQPIVRISKTDMVKIIVGVPEKSYPSLKKGTTAIIMLDAYPNKRFQGRVAVISPTLDPSTRTGNVEIHIDNKNGLVRPGMFANVELFLERRSLLMVPEMALMKAPGTADYTLFVVNEGVSELRSVAVGLTYKEYREIRGGLKRDELIVQTGQHQLKDKMLVKVVNSSDGGL
ncbi:MAG: efflux RND transporter periplasmic adaptor subunit [Spirochaetota bacterium]|nr:efflux RND transporter periplasmic adaptor subunit [Spirochaetota bacterium]